MDDHNLLFNALIYLVAAVVCVPLAKKLGLGSVIGYLLAGVAIGPWGFGFIHNAEDIMHFAEFGVVLLLFLIGLELNPSRLWAMRRPILGLGGSQVIGTTALLFIAGFLLGLTWQVALVAAMGLSLSSTAIALQILGEKNLLPTPVGNSGFSILLFQDIAVIPMLALIPLLATTAHGDDTSNPWFATLKVIMVILAIIIGGRYLIQPLFRLIAQTRSREIFTAFSLLLVIGIALLMQSVDMSMALGSFLAGVLLAESEYRHQLESDIEPFKGLLLGLFFISVGMSINFGLLATSPWLILGLVFGLVGIKICVLFVLAKLFKIPPSQHYFFAFLLSQGGEFAFVIFGIASTLAIAPTPIIDLLVVTVALSMISTPILMILDEKLIEPRFNRLTEKPEPDIINEENPVIIAGFGRYGQIVARLLHANKIPTTIIDHSPEHIDRVRRFGFKIFYGDITRMDLLHAAGIEKAKLFILTIDDREASIAVVKILKEHYPHVTILARAWDMVHVYELLDHDVKHFERETFESALRTGATALHQLGYPAFTAHQATLKFRQYDFELLYRQYEVHKDEEQLISISKQATQELDKLFEADEIALDQTQDSGWG